MNAVTDFMIKLHLTAQTAPGNLMARLHDEERGATQTVEVVALAAVLILVLAGLTQASDTIGTAFGDAVSTILDAATGTGGGG